MKKFKSHEITVKGTLGVTAINVKTVEDVEKAVQQIAPANYSEVSTKDGEYGIIEIHKTENGEYRYILTYNGENPYDATILDEYNKIIGYVQITDEEIDEVAENYEKAQKKVEIIGGRFYTKKDVVKSRKVNCTLGRSVYKDVHFTERVEISKEEAEEILKNYGFTAESYIAYKNGDRTEEKAEVEVEEYAITPEAQEVAIQAEIDNAEIAKKFEKAVAEVKVEIEKRNVAGNPEVIAQLFLEKSWEHDGLSIRLALKEFKQDLAYINSLKRLTAKRKAEKQELEELIADREHKIKIEIAVGKKLLALRDMYLVMPEDDGSNDDDDKEFLLTLDTSVDDDNDDDELVDEPEYGVIYETVEAVVQAEVDNAEAEAERTAEASAFEIEVSEESTPAKMTVTVSENNTKVLAQKLMANIATLSSIYTAADDTYEVFDVNTKATVQIEGSEEETATSLDEAYKKATAFFIVEDDGSNDDPDEDFLATYDASIDEDSETDELIDKPEEVKEMTYEANTYIYKGGSSKNTVKDFKSAISAFNYLAKKVKRYAGTTDWAHTIDIWDGKHYSNIYRNDCNGNEQTTDAEIQVLIDDRDFEIEVNINAREAKLLAEDIDGNYGLAGEELFDFLIYYYEKTGTYFENAGIHARKVLKDWLNAKKTEKEISEYAVTPEAVEVAVQAEIDNAAFQFDLQAANNAEEPEIFTAMTLIYKRDAWFENTKDFKTAVEAYDYLQKKAKRYSAKTAWEHSITEVADSKENVIYTNGSDDDEWADNAEIQALLNTEKAEVDSTEVVKDDEKDFLDLLESETADSAVEKPAEEVIECKPKLADKPYTCVTKRVGDFFNPKKFFDTLNDAVRYALVDKSKRMDWDERYNGAAVCLVYENGMCRPIWEITAEGKFEMVDASEDYGELDNDAVKAELANIDTAQSINIEKDIVETLNEIKYCNQDIERAKSRMENAKYWGKTEDVSIAEKDLLKEEKAKAKELSKLAEFSTNYPKIYAKAIKAEKEKYGAYFNRTYSGIATIES